MRGQQPVAAAEGAEQAPSVAAMNAHVIPLFAPQAADPTRVGPKAANLAALGHAGLPIPDGFCLVADAYRAQIAALGLEASARGDSMLDPELMAHAAPRADSVLHRLTDRQYAVLQLLAQGLSNQGIAARLGIAEKSVQNHLTSIYSILDVPADSAKNPRVLAALTLLAETGRDS